MRRNFIAKEKGAVSFDNQLLRGYTKSKIVPTINRGAKFLNPTQEFFFFLGASLSAAKCEPESR